MEHGSKEGKPLAKLSVLLSSISRVLSIIHFAQISQGERVLKWQRLVICYCRIRRHLHTQLFWSESSDTVKESSLSLEDTAKESVRLQSQAKKGMLCGKENTFLWFWGLKGKSQRKFSCKKECKSNLRRDFTARHFSRDNNFQDWRRTENRHQFNVVSFSWSKCNVSRKYERRKDKPLSPT